MKKILLVDAAINFLLGVALIIYSDGIVDTLGIPSAESSFYPNILGAVFIGITLALVIECFRRSDGPAGLGLTGAVVINLCAVAMLVIWLLIGDLDIPSKGRIFLWALSVIVVIVVIIELAIWRKKKTLNIK
jgi:hypothetical protein